MALLIEFLKDQPEETSPESRNKRLAAALQVPPFVDKRIMLIERVEEGESGWRVCFHG